MGEIDDTLLLNALMKAAVDAMVISDEQGRILRVNQAAARLFQRDHDALIGENVSILMPEILAEQHAGFMKHHMETGNRKIIGRSRDVLGARSDGTTVPLLLSIGRADTDHGAIFVSIMQDKTDRHTMEEAVARSQRLDAIGRMTGGLSHDFNNLLTVIIGNLELLENADLTDRQRSMLADALSAAELGADVTSRLTAFARKSELQASVIDLNDQLGKSLALLQHSIGKHCKITAQSQPGLWPVMADAAQLQTAILNLAMNSQDAMPEGGILALETQNVTIDDEFMAQELDVVPGQYVRLSVSDTGQGMTATERAHALEPFFTTKAAGHGTGLGLSMVYGFVKQSGGYLTLYSEQGNGTTVALYFPALGQQNDTPGQDEAATEAVHIAPASGTILIVEDDANLRRLTKTRLSALGFDCMTCDTADAAWDVVSKGADIALVFTDMVMPGKLTGYDLAQRIAEAYPDIPVLLTSGFSETVMRDRWVGPEFPMLRKPYRQADLERAIYAVLSPG